MGCEGLIKRSWVLATMVCGVQWEGLSAHGLQEAGFSPQLWPLQLSKSILWLP